MRLASGWPSSSIHRLFAPLLHHTNKNVEGRSVPSAASKVGAASEGWQLAVHFFVGVFAGSPAGREAMASAAPEARVGRIKQPARVLAPKPYPAAVQFT